MNSERPADGTRPNYYEVLQVSPTASQEVIQAAYRALAREYHPDVNPDARAARRMLLLNKAYDVLGDSQRRAEYDLQRTRSSRVVTARPAPRGAPPSAKTRGVPPRETVRGVPPARAGGRGAAGRHTPGRPRVILATAAITLFLVFVCLVLWALSLVLDEAPEAASLKTPTAATALNHFLTATERPLTAWGTQSGHDATSA
jgi:curved DNA-binding protein CbpA